MSGRFEHETFYCSFCGKAQYDVTKLIAGPRVFICAECVDLCYEITHPPARPLPPPSAGNRPRLCRECRWAKMDDRYFRPEGPQWMCLHAEAAYMPEPDYVTGKAVRPQHTDCYAMRKGICGAKGKFWEPRTTEATFSGVIGFGEALRGFGEPEPK